MSIIDWFRRRGISQDINKGNVNIDKGLKFEGGTLPYPVDSISVMSGYDFKVPIQQIPWRNLYDIVYYSDVLRTVVKVITDEVFRNGFYLQQKFASKCTRCEAEFEDVKLFCPFCGGVVRKPDEKEKEKAKKWLEGSVNGFNERLYEVLKQVDTDINITDNGFIVLIKDYVYDSNGKLIGWNIREVVRGSPLTMRLIWSRYGMGRGQNGEYMYVCPVHRDELVKKNKEGVYYCDKCGRQLLPAYYVQWGFATRTPIYYAKGEVYHLKRWSNIQGYGFPPVLTIMLKTLTLMKMDRQMYLAYTLMRSPKGLLVIRGKENEIRRAWAWLMQKSRENPNMIYPLTISGADGAKKLVEWVDFNLTPAEMQWTSVREEFRRNIGMVYGVMPLFQGDLSQGGGLNNEGLQITVTNRTVDGSQFVWNEFLKWFSEQIGMNDWYIQLRPNEEKDMAAELNRMEQKVRIMGELMQLGFDVELVKGVDGFDFRVKEGKPKQMNNGGGLGSMLGGGVGNEGGESENFGGNGQEGANPNEVKMGSVSSNDIVEKAIRDVVDRIGVEEFLKKLGSIVDEFGSSPYRPRKKRKENMNIDEGEDVVSENTNKDFGEGYVLDSNNANAMNVRYEKKRKKKEDDSSE